MIHIIKHSKFDKPIRVYVCGEDLVYIKDLIDNGLENVYTETKDNFFILVVVKLD